MESYDVIANQPVVIDNGCSPSRAYALLPEGIASRVSVWAAGSLSLARPVRRVQPPPPLSSLEPKSADRATSWPAAMRRRTLGWIREGL